jgi:hypothetical protein
MRFHRLLVTVAVVTQLVVLGGRASATTTFTCGVPVTTNVTLSGNVYCPGSSGIVIGADGLTIDLNHHTVSGDLSGNGLDAAGHDDIVVKNGEFLRFAYGIFAENASDRLSLRHMEVVYSAQMGIVIDGSSPHIDTTESLNGGSFGILITGDDARISATRASGNGQAGIDVHGARAHLRGVDVEMNATHGAAILGHHPRVANTRANENQQDGIHIEGSAARVRSSVARRNGSNGIVVSGDAPDIGQLPGGPTSDKNHADDNGSTSSRSGLGIWALNYTFGPQGHNEAHGNASGTDCIPEHLC